MSFRSIRPIGLLVSALVILCLSSAIHAIEKIPAVIGKARVGVKFGTVGSGTFTQDNSEYAKESALSFGMFADAPSSTALSFGAFLDFHKFKVDQEESEIGMFGTRSFKEEYWVNFGAASKYTIPASGNRLLLRPGVAVGYGRLGENIFGKQSHYLTLGFFWETIYLFTPRVGLVGDIGLLMVPVGGNAIGTVSSDGMLVIRGGLVF